MGTPEWRNRKAFTQSSRDHIVISAAAICSLESREQNGLCSLGGRGMLSLSHLSIIATLTNYRCLWARECRKGCMVFCSECVTLSCHTKWAAVRIDVFGWLQVSWRKHALVFTVSLYWAYKWNIKNDSCRIINYNIFNALEMNTII